MKTVIYNGNIMSYPKCSNADLLEIGKVYEVVSEKISGWYTMYTLKGIEGEFNSLWFDHIDNDEVNTYFAVSKEIPQKGKRFKCKRFVFNGETYNTEHCITSEIKFVEHLERNYYKVITKNSIYLVDVL